MLGRTGSLRVFSSVALAILGCSPPAAAPTDAGADAPIDAHVAASDVGLDAGRAPDVCDALSLTRTPFRTTGMGTGMGQVAGDFTVHTLNDGTFSLESNWSGCESYVFFVHLPGVTDGVIHTAPDRLLTEGRRNVRYFYISAEPDEGARIALMEALAALLEEAFAFQAIDDPAEQQFWRERFHYVTDDATAIDGSVSAYLNAYLTYARTAASAVDLGTRGRAYPPPPAVFGIDRAQTWDPGDSMSPAVGAPADQLGMAAFLSQFYEYRGTLEARLAAETGTTVVSLLDQTTTGRVFTEDVTLPAAAAMAGFDTMEVDVEITCNNGNPFGCSEWDRIADVQLCVDGHACTERLEIARWITPYWRRGRQHYLIDATPLLGLLRDGGDRSFFVELGPDWERATEWDAQISLRLRTQGARPRATGAVRAFTGGAFDASYNMRPPFTFTPPAGVTRVELVTILTGHGQTAGDSCAEWCDHRHDFSVNGTAVPEIRHEGARIGTDRGCAARASEGVIPGQWGNWAQSRAYWCPGLATQPLRTDITSSVTPGSPNELTYQGHLGTAAPRGGDIDLSAYVVWYVDP